METELIRGMSGVEESDILSLLESQTTDLESRIASLEVIVREKSVERGFEYQKKRYNYIFKQNEEFHRTNKPLISDFKLNVLEVASTSLIDTIKTFIADFGDKNEIGQAERVLKVMKRLRDDLYMIEDDLENKVKWKAEVLHREKKAREANWNLDLASKDFPLLTWLENNYHVMSHRFIQKAGPEVNVDENGKFYMVKPFSRFIEWKYYYEIRWRQGVCLEYTLDLYKECITIFFEYDSGSSIRRETKVTSNPDEVMGYFNNLVDLVMDARKITSNDP